MAWTSKTPSTCRVSFRMAGKVPRVEAEHTISPETVAELTRCGFEIVPADDPIGGARAVRIDWGTGH